MNRLLVSVVLVATMPTLVAGALVYSGSQNVVLQLTPSNPMASATINIAGQSEKWDDFRVDLWLDMSMMGMPGTMATMGMPGMTSMSTRLAIYGPGMMTMGGMSMGMGMGMGGILGFANRALNLPMGAMPSPYFSLLGSASLHGDGKFEDDGGYIGIVTEQGQQGWLHMLGQSGIDTDSHTVVFDAWAVEDRPGVPLAMGEGPCDWLPGGPHKMHWPQPPDLSPAGVDVSGMGTVLADDFKCTATGPVARIHVWGSFARDVLPTRGVDGIPFEVSIYSDVPAQQDAPSRPGSLLWTRTFMPGEYTVRNVHDGPEGWYDPLTDVYEQANHRQAYQYNFCVEKDPFTQQEGTIYWLAVKVLDATNAIHKFGWKTTPPDYRWNDDTAYLAVDGSWQPLTYPRSHEYAGQTLDLAFVIDSGRDPQAKYDLGDAPDSSNSLSGVPMTAYPKGGPAGVTANYPTVRQAGSPPYGPVHRDPKGMAFLGYGVTLENEADIGPDMDPTNNLDPSADAPDADGSDDGVTVPLVLPGCKRTTFDYVVTVVNPAATQFYVNVWLDWNRDGDWDDTVTCADGTVVSEWAVQNHLPVVAGPGTWTITTPEFTSWHPSTEGDPDPIWMRITLSDSKWMPSVGAAGSGGSGPADGYRFGETEDYFFYPKNESSPAKYDWGDAPDGRAAPGYPTLSSNNGARHVIAGPWLGDVTGVPDADAEGQPDPNALGDDIDENDDEEGVSIPSLVQGESAIIALEVGGGGGVVQAWIDFNGDMAWQNSEQVFNGYLPDGSHTISVIVPDDAKVGQSFARFRISTKGGLGPGGLAADGEVEDHDVSIYTAPPQLKRAQWPDLTPNGIDIRVDNSDGKVRWLADDFKCTSTNRITEVHLWGSWKDDRKGRIRRIFLTIHPDDPAGPGGPDPQNPSSKPAPEILWTGSFIGGEFQETLYHVVSDPGEWWWDPATGELVAGGDKEVWRIDITVDPRDAFLQQGSAAKPVIYWLEVRFDTGDGQFGWKTRQWPDHYMDDAVWDEGAQSPRVWQELRYPKDHPYYALEKNSIDMAFYFTYTGEIVDQPTTRPGSVTQCPVVETRCPAVETKCPAVKTQCPVYTTRCPMTKTRCPSVTTQCPTVQTKCPVVATKCPPVETKCPITATKCPVAATKCPESLTKCPPTVTKCQVGDTRCPAVETKCPVAATKCPEALTKCPPTVTQCQVVQTQCPPVDTQCPSVDTKCPVAATKCPESLTKCPPTATKCQVVDTQCPTVETKCPVAATKCPESLTKCPPTATRCQVVQTQCPPVDTQCPTVETKCPVAATKCPESLTKCPPTATKCQVVDTQCPTVETKCPVAATRCPESLTKCPPTATQCQTVATQCPVVLTQCPESLTKCPPTATKCQVVDTQCPTVETKCPVAATKCPESLTKCPPTPTQCQAVDTQCPPVTTRCPETLTRCPPTSTLCQTVHTQCPAVLTECPESLTKCPPTPTQCQTVQTQCPVVQTNCPPADTRCPAEPTRCPAASTQCPRVNTQCPTEPTKCPVVTTRCPESLTKCPPTVSACQVVQTQCPVVSTECPPSLTKCPATVTLCPTVPTQCPRCVVMSASVATAAPCPTIDAICPSFVAMKP